MPDSSYLTLAARKAVPDAQVVRIRSEAELVAFAGAPGRALLLVNRQLDGDFTDLDGITLIARARTAWPELQTMLVSNYPDAQARAREAGAMPGFGKREVGSPAALERIRAAFAPVATKVT